MDWVTFLAHVVRMIQDGTINPDEDVTPDDLNAVYAHAQIRNIIFGVQKDIDEGRL